MISYDFLILSVKNYCFVGISKKMLISNEIKGSLALSGTSTNISDDVYQKLIENCFCVLLKRPEVHNLAALYGSKPDIVKEVYSSLLKISAEFARNDLNKDTVYRFLIDECKYSKNRAEDFAIVYDKHKLKLQVILGNIGMHLPHITDVNWKIDYVVQSSSILQSEGPLFRIGLVTEVFDKESQGNKRQTLNFTCTAQELQDLVYKLKDAVRHCNRIVSEH